MRWLWQCRTDDARPWHGLLDKAEKVVEAMFSASIYVDLGDGRKALFWSDQWLQGQSVADLAPCLCNAVGSRVKKKRTVAQALHHDRWIRDIHGAVTVQVIIDYLRIWDSSMLHVVTRFVRCGHRTKSSRQHLLTVLLYGSTSDRRGQTLQKVRAPAKCKFFTRLVLHDRCWTADRRKWYGLQDDDTCVLCNQSSGTIEHLLVACPFSREVWFHTLWWLGWEPVAPSTQTTWFTEWWNSARKRVPKIERKCFDSMVALICWLLWKERNNRTFDRCVQTVQDMLR